MQKRIFTLAISGLFALSIFAQSNSNELSNTAEYLNSGNSGLNLGGYGEVHYNQGLSSDVRSNGKLDVHRIVLFMGYSFSPKTQFVSEIEFEHVGELAVEQAYLQHRINSYINLQGGLMLVPMGLTNLYHEPTNFNGVERPIIDSKIAPTTWREIGFGFQGNAIDLNLKYQLYVMNGFSGYNGSSLFNASNALRKGRQQGAESYISSPDFAGRVQYYGVSGLNLGISGYLGNSQSTLYDGLNRNDNAALATADSSVINVSMLGLDYTYRKGGFESRGQLYLTKLGNTDQYNQYSNLTSKALGSSMYGYYVEAGYDLLSLCDKTKYGLVPFIRYQAYDTQASMESLYTKDPVNSANIITAGINFKLAQGAVVKADLDFTKNGASTQRQTTLNLGFGVNF